MFLLLYENYDIRECRGLEKNHYCCRREDEVNNCPKISRRRTMIAAKKTGDEWRRLG